MSKSNFSISVLITIVMLSASCVSGKKYSSLQDTSKQFMNERDAFKTDNIGLEMQNKELEAKLISLEKEMGTVKEEISTVQSARDRAVEDYNKISSKYNELQNAQEDLIKGNVKETQKLLSELQAAQENLQKKEDLLRQLEQNLDTKKASLDERNARMAELEKILDAQKKIVQDLKNKVSEALLGFENNGLTVSMKNGKVYVSLEEKLLFKSASWDIDVNGKNALKRLAGVLEKNPDIQVMIEGYTDNVPYNPGSGQLKDNWDLSVKRATTVVRVLLEGSRINARRLTASGRSEYLPVDDRNTPEARQKNRRTEIILTPDLTELYKLIDKY
jgi:chemotaxis protein MotB